MRVDPSLVLALVRVVVAVAGIGSADDGGSFGPHVLCHAFGPDLVRGRGEVAAKPVDVVLVAELMGHTGLNTPAATSCPPRPTRPSPWRHAPLTGEDEVMSAKFGLRCPVTSE